MQTLEFFFHIRYFSVKNLWTAFVYWLSDIVFRFKSKYSRIRGIILEFSNHEMRSDSEMRPYMNFIERAAISPEIGMSFRRDSQYREILEHVGYFLGGKYLRELNGFESFDANQLKKHSRNDTYGTPRTFSFLDNLNLSMTTVRYLVTWYQLEGYLRPLENSKWVEIGCGYGGQAAVIERMISPESYTIFDVPQAERLIIQYLKNIGSELVPSFESLENISDEQTYDYAISNYAFSELPRQLQMEYLTKVLSKSRHGFMIMNSGRSNLSGRSKGKLMLREVQEFLPSLKVLEEQPRTGPDNYLIIW